ncbi:MAG: S4 domain-containing protein, partial [Acidobacteriota bacterium]|nr:S4 domain-containing protein [Acidobacteriota bacterium]
MNGKITLKAEEYWERIDHFLTALLQSQSRSRVEKLIKNGRVAVNGAVETKKSREISPGDLIVVTPEIEEKVAFVPS